MPELGKTLSQARVARALTLEDCERDTRISKRYLDALEREDWRSFPAPVYSRAFLRTYAQYLGLDPNELMRLFRNQTATEEAQLRPLPEVPAAPTTGNMNFVLAGAVMVLLLLAGVFLYFSRGDGDGGQTVLNEPLPIVSPEGEGGGQVAAGRPVGDITEGEVPDLAGVLVDDALTALQQAGLNYVVVETDVDGTPGIVSSQDPAPGTKGGSSTSVTLVVPRG